MNNKYKAVLFDLDGTLLDTSIGILESVQFTIAHLNLKSLPEKVLHRFVGPPVQDSFVREFGFSIEDAQRAADIFRNYYKNFGLLKASIYEGILDFLVFLRKEGYKVAVATYKRHDYAISLLDSFGVSTLCNVVNGADNNNVLKKSDIVLKCIEDLGIKNFNECVLIGDTDHDAVGAQQVGIDFIGVTYGFGFKSRKEIEQFKNAGYATSVEGLYKYFQGTL